MKLLEEQNPTYRQRKTLLQLSKDKLKLTELLSDAAIHNRKLKDKFTDIMFDQISLDKALELNNWIIKNQWINKKPEYISEDMFPNPIIDSEGFFDCKVCGDRTNYDKVTGVCPKCW